MVCQYYTKDTNRITRSKSALFGEKTALMANRHRRRPVLPVYLQEFFWRAAYVFAEYGTEIFGIEEAAFLRDDIRLFSGFGQQRDRFLQTVTVHGK